MGGPRHLDALSVRELKAELERTLARHESAVEQYRRHLVRYRADAALRAGRRRFWRWRYPATIAERRERWHYWRQRRRRLAQHAKACGELLGLPPATVARLGRFPERVLRHAEISPRRRRRGSR